MEIGPVTSDDDDDRLLVVQVEEVNCLCVLGDGCYNEERMQRLFCLLVVERDILLVIVCSYSFLPHKIQSTVEPEFDS